MKPINKLKQAMSNIFATNNLSSVDTAVTKAKYEINEQIKGNDKLAEDPPRREFISKALLGGAGVVAAGSVLANHADDFDWHSGGGAVYDDAGVVARLVSLEGVDIVHNWNTIVSKPSTFPPSAHTHDDLTGRLASLEGVDPVHDWNNIINRPSTYPATAHTHSNYADINHSHTNYADINHTHSNYVTGTVSTSATANTIAKRDGNADITARQFKGVATSALWADLAEKYEADAEYDEGVVLGVGGKNEVTEFQPGMPLAGVVSFYPAFKMNDRPEHANWPYLALKGRVPVKIIGQAIKGNYIIADSNGKGIAMGEITTVQQQMRLIGMALESGSDIVEVKI